MLAYEQLMLRVAAVCEKQNWPYYVTGSVASMAYGEPRYTQDVDVVVRLPRENAEVLCEAFPGPDFYADPQSARDAARQGGQFNIIWASEGVKADIIMQRAGAFEESCLARAQRILLPSGESAMFASPEDIVLCKLEFYRDGGSDKHLRDITGMFRIRRDAMDLQYIHEWVKRLGIQLEWQAVLARLGKP